ncbi:hypothetical protein ACFSSA_06775 [Luteolibacter algae]|uniref:Uncharacterized protein n=1 Tax=Luteolibacter algae TaxID=454151 RepID=A0ABW5D9T6_9BACT
MRFFSFIIFALMTVVLPVAGVQRHFCTMSMAFIDYADQCPATGKDCCGKNEPHRPVEPDCMISAKVLPNADKANPSHLPTLDLVWTLAPVSLPDLLPSTRLESSAAAMHRGPPLISRLYILQQRLLI